MHKPMRVMHLASGLTATGTSAELHHAVTGWLASDGAEPQTLAEVDELFLAVEAGRYSAHLQVRVGVEVDEL